MEEACRYHTARGQSATPAVAYGRRPSIIRFVVRAPSRRNDGLAWAPAVALLAAALALVPGLAGCGERVPYPGGFWSSDPYVRVRTIQSAAERQDRDALPVLVERLEDGDPGVRFYAILALERMTGTRLGYNYADPAPERDRAVKRWLHWLRASTQPATRTAESAPIEGGSRP